MRTVDVAERRARLARRHLLATDTQAELVTDATAAMMCLHATDPATVYLSAWRRVRGMSVADLDKALYADRSLVKHLAMRRTLWVLPRDLLPAVQAGASERVGAAESRRLAREVEKAGLFADGEAWLTRVSAAVLEALADGREATSSELRAEIPLLDAKVSYGEGRSWGGEYPVGPRVLNTLSARGRIVRASNIGNWLSSRPRWTTVRAWLGSDIEPMDEHTATTALVEQWLRVFGPGTLQDIKWWLGSTLGSARKALAAVEAVEVDLGGETGYLLPDDLEPPEPVEPWTALLPGLDPTTMGWFDRGWYLGAHKAELFDRTGNGGTSAWWNGRIVGGWHQNESGDVVLDLLEKVDPAARGALEAEAGQLTEWLEGVRVSPRFPSPLSQRGRRRT